MLLLALFVKSGLLFYFHSLTLHSQPKSTRPSSSSSHFLPPLSHNRDKEKVSFFPILSILMTGRNNCVWFCYRYFHFQPPGIPVPSRDRILFFVISFRSRKVFRMRDSVAGMEMGESKGGQVLCGGEERHAWNGRKLWEDCVASCVFRTSRSDSKSGVFPVIIVMQNNLFYVTSYFNEKLIVFFFTRYVILYYI